MKKWSEKELALLGSKSDKQLATELGRSVPSVRLKRQERGIVAAAHAEPSYDADRERASNELWRRKYKELDKKYHKAVEENSVIEQLVSEIKDLAPLSYLPAPKISQVRVRGVSKEQSAVLLFSDQHIGKVVHPSQTLGFGEYNFNIFLARLKYLEESVVSILKNHTTMRVSELVVAMLGDGLDGALLHGNEAAQRNTLFSQFYSGGHAIAQFLRVLAAHVPKIRIQTVVGNHTRFANQKRMPTENRFSNLDSFLYALVEALTRDVPNIQWHLNQQPFQIFDVQGWVFHAAHGDHWQGGDKALGVPSHSIGREISTRAQLFVKHKLPPINYYVSAHLHREIQLPHALGSIIINGGFPGLDNYGLAGNFTPADPSQRFFFIHPRFGKTAEYSLSLKFAETTEKPPYQIPEGFEIE